MNIEQLKKMRQQIVAKGKAKYSEGADKGRKEGLHAGIAGEWERKEFNQTDVTESVRALLNSENYVVKSGVIYDFIVPKETRTREVYIAQEAEKRSKKMSAYRERVKATMKKHKCTWREAQDILKTGITEVITTPDPVVSIPTPSKSQQDAAAEMVGLLQAAGVSIDTLKAVVNG